MRKLLLLILIFAISANVHAGLFTAIITPEQQTINQDEKAYYNITVAHTLKTIEFFEIYSPEVLWDIRVHDALQIMPGQAFTTTLTIQPLNINPGLYGVPIHVKRTGTNDLEKSIVYMEVIGSPSSLTYLPAVRGTVEIQQFVDPREEVVVTVNLVNQNRRDLKEINIKLRSDVINQDFTRSLKPSERKTERLEVKIDPATPPQQDTLQVTVIVTEADKAYQFDLPPINYAITSYGQLAPTVELTEAFLKKTRMITIANKANIVLQEPFAYPLPWYARLFTRTTPESRTENGQLVWDIALNVGHSSELRVTTNYRPLAIGILLAIVFGILYFMFRSPLTIRKSATVYSTREGGISELKVLLELRNRTGKPIRQAKVIDLVPRIAELIQEFGVGTLAPVKVIQNDNKGTIVKYEIGDILPYEERIISYKIKSKLSILGGVSLPVAVGKFTTEKGRERNTSSNTPRVKFFG